MRARLLLLLSVSTICFGSSAAAAQTGAAWLVNRMGSVVKAEVTWEQVRLNMIAAFYSSNPDERGVTAQGVDAIRLTQAAQRRAQVMAQLLAYDLDGDGAVTKGELTTFFQPRSRQMIGANGVQLEPTPQQSRAQLDKLVGDALKADTDGDGVISAAEIKQAGQKRAEQETFGWRQMASQYVPLSLDANGDGAVSFAEYETAVRVQFDAFDQDKDGRISPDEFTEFGKRLNEARQDAQRERDASVRKARFELAAKGCEVPVAAVGARLLLLGTNGAAALSNASIGNEDKVTYVATVEIAPGNDPLYLALTSRSAVIWDIVGATERIVGVVAHSETPPEMPGDGSGQRRVAATEPSPVSDRGRPLVGVMGVPRNKVWFTAHMGCLIPVSEASMKDGTAQQMAAMLLGREADEIGAAENASAFRVPGVQHVAGGRVRNAIRLPEGGRGEPLWREVQEAFTRGIAQIDVESVVAAHPVKRYGILPGRAGLAELVDAGSLTVAGMSHGVRFNGSEWKPYTSPEKFRVTQKIRLPAGTKGTFILPRDVPAPQGVTSRACLVSEWDMKPISGQPRNACR